MNAWASCLDGGRVDTPPLPSSVKSTGRHDPGGYPARWTARTATIASRKRPMPKITVRVPHQGDPKDTMTRIRGALDKTVKDFQGVDLELTPGDTSADFKFRSMAFTITG